VQYLCTSLVGDGRDLFVFSSRRRHTRSKRDWSSDVCSSDLKNKMPQYTVGHRERLRETNAEMNASLPGVYLAGSSYTGVAVPDCIKQAEEAVESVIDYLN